MTVARLCDEMSGDEYVRWGVYYGRKAQREQLEEAKARARKGRK